MPMPASVKVIVFAWSSVATVIFSGASGSKISAPEVCRNFSFSDGVRRIRDQLADEDLFVRVERMNDDLEQLRDLGLEGVFFGSHAVKLVAPSMASSRA